MVILHVIEVLLSLFLSGFVGLCFIKTVCVLFRSLCVLFRSLCSILCSIFRDVLWPTCLFVDLGVDT